MREQELIVVLLGSRDNYNRFKPLLKDSSLTTNGKWFVDQIGAYYAKTGDSNPKVEDFERFFWATRAGHLKPGAEVELYEILFKALRSKEYKEEIVQEILEHYTALDYTNKILDIGEGIVKGTGKQSLDDIGTLVEQYREEVNRSVTHADLFAEEGLSDAAARVAAPGLEWRLPELNLSAGPLRKGDLVIIGARPEVGKTTFMASEIAWMAQQLNPDERVLLVNNEEQSDKVHMRIVQAALALPLKDILSDVKAAEDNYDMLVGKGKIKITRQDLGANARDLEAIIKEMCPSLIVFDQLDKVASRGPRDEREDERLGRLYLWARTLSAKYCPVIALSQVNATGEGQRWLTQAQLRGSNTDKAGEADLIILIGKDHAPGLEDQRFINIAKNKLAGGPKTTPALRHGKFEVTIQPEIARYKGTY